MGDLIDIHFTADDLTGQKGSTDLAGALPTDDQTAMGADHRRDQEPHQGENLLPRLRRVDTFLPDLIEIGVDIINPVQVSAAGMDTAQLKKKYGKDAFLLGRRLRHAESAAPRHAGRSAGRDAKTHPRPRPRRRLRLQSSSQYPTEGARREHHDDVRDGQGISLLKLSLDCHVTNAWGRANLPNLARLAG